MGADRAGQYIGSFSCQIITRTALTGGGAAAAPERERERGGRDGRGDC